MIKIAHWEITKKCNLSCLHCISAKGSRKELETDKALQVVEILSNLGCKEIYLTGGEPLIRKDIFKILERCKEKNIKIGLLTNGTLINNKNIKEIKSFVKEIGISLDGASPGINDKIRGKGTFTKIIKAISIIKNNQIPLSLYVTINNLNIGDIENILKLTLSLGIKFIRINEISLRGRAYKNRKILSINNQKELNLRKYLITIFKKVFGESHIKAFITNKCEINPTTIFLSPLGYFYPCIEIFQKKPEFYLGNILHHTPQNFEKLKEISYFFKKIKCPYQFIVGKQFAICLNNSSIKCPFTTKKLKHSMNYSKS